MSEKPSTTKDLVGEAFDLGKNLGRTDVSDIVPPDSRVRPRKKGSARETRSVRRVRAAMAKLLETNAPKYQEWLERAAEKDPLKALVLLKDISEFYMPKLGRIEQTGTVEHKVSHFVAVTEREERPKALDEANSPDNHLTIDGEFTPGKPL